MRLLNCLFFVLFAFSPVLAQEKIIFSSPDNIRIGDRLEILEDTNSSLTIEEVMRSTGFKKSEQAVPNFEFSGSSFWIRFEVENRTGEDLVLELSYPTIDSVLFISFDTVGGYSIVETGEHVPYHARKYEHQNYIFDLNVLPGTSRKFLMRVKASEQYILPLTLGTTLTISESLFNKDLIFGFYAGIILVMFLYNLFIYFTVRDQAYLRYVLYILVVGLTQACLQGYSPRFLYPDSDTLPNLMMVIIPAMSGVTAIWFLRDFMQVKNFTPGLNRLLNVFLLVYGAVIAMGFFKLYLPASQIMQVNVMLLAVVVVIIGSRISMKGYRPAKFFMFAWIIFLASVIVFVLRNFNVLPYNNFTLYALQIGSALEVILLSFALGDKINALRKEKEESQAQAMAALEENARIVSEQNVVLETKVSERTLELQASNEELNKTLKELKEAEMQLVESEKMASLGQLTAGIAHEINNPINFVTSNVKPLKRDVEMIINMLGQVENISLAEASVEEKQKQISELKEEYDFDYLKTEIDYLLKGITEGSSRTAEIVKGLRIFSRLDEDDLKKASINEGLDSTMVIVNNLMDSRIEVIRNYGNIPMVECYPGKLNQVFLNIITNAIHAIKSKFREGQGGQLTITTFNTENTVSISIKDNGIGMDDNTKKKLFEPFFTTKDVGEGTGLGLSIAYNTIKKHNGTIDVNSEPGAGTEFIIEIPIVQ